MNQPSLQQLFANRRGQSNVYGGPAPTARRRQAPPPRRSPAGGKDSRYEQMREQLRQEGGKKNAAEEMLGDRNPLARGLGTVFGGAAQAVGFMGRGVVAGVEGLADTPLGHLQSQVMDNPLGRAAVNAMPGANLASNIVNRVDTEREDDRSFMDKVTDVEFGYGQIAKSTGSKWGDRFQGFAGDVVLDPLTYVGGAAAKTAGATGRAGRTGMASTLARAGYGDEVVGEASSRGAAYLSDGAREAVNVPRAGLYFGVGRGSARIPGTEKIGRGLEKGFANTRRKVMSPITDRTNLGMRTIDELKDARKVLNKGVAINGLTPVVAAERVRFHDDVRLIGKQVAEVHGRKAKALLEGLDERAARVMSAGVERGDTGTEQWRAVYDGLFAEMRKAGIDVGDITNYVPHRWTREGVKWMQETPAGRAVASALQVDPTADPSAVLRRVIKGGSKIDLPGNKQIVVPESGTIADIQAAISRVVPDAPKVLEDDIRLLTAGYIQEVSRAIGLRQAWKNLEESGSGILKDLDSVAVDELNQLATITANVKMKDLLKSAVGRRKKALNKRVREAAEVDEQLRSTMDQQLDAAARNLGKDHKDLREQLKVLTKEIGDLNGDEKVVRQQFEDMRATVGAKYSAAVDELAEIEESIRAAEAFQSAPALPRGNEEFLGEIAGASAEMKRLELARARVETAMDDAQDAMAAIDGFERELQDISEKMFKLDELMDSPEELAEYAANNQWAVRGEAEMQRQATGRERWSKTLEARLGEMTQKDGAWDGELLRQARQAERHEEIVAAMDAVIERRIRELRATEATAAGLQARIGQRSRPNPSKVSKNRRNAARAERIRQDIDRTRASIRGRERLAAARRSKTAAEGDWKKVRADYWRHRLLATDDKPSLAALDDELRYADPPTRRGHPEWRDQERKSRIAGAEAEADRLEVIERSLFESYSAKRDELEGLMSSGGTGQSTQAYELQMMKLIKEFAEAKRAHSELEAAILKGTEDPNELVLRKTLASARAVGDEIARLKNSRNMHAQLVKRPNPEMNTPATMREKIRLRKKVERAEEWRNYTYKRIERDVPTRPEPQTAEQLEGRLTAAVDRLGALGEGPEFPEILAKVPSRGDDIIPDDDARILMGYLQGLRTGVEDAQAELRRLQNQRRKEFPTGDSKFGDLKVRQEAGLESPGDYSYGGVPLDGQAKLREDFTDVGDGAVQYDGPGAAGRIEPRGGRAGEVFDEAEFNEASVLDDDGNLIGQATDELDGAWGGKTSEDVINDSFSGFSPELRELEELTSRIKMASDALSGARRAEEAAMRAYGLPGRDAGSGFAYGKFGNIILVNRGGAGKRWPQLGKGTEAVTERQLRAEVEAAGLMPKTGRNPKHEELAALLGDRAQRYKPDTQRYDALPQELKERVNVEAMKELIADMPPGSRRALYADAREDARGEWMRANRERRALEAEIEVAKGELDVAMRVRNQLAQQRRGLEARRAAVTADRDYAEELIGPNRIDADAELQAAGAAVRQRGDAAAGVARQTDEAGQASQRQAADLEARRVAAERKTQVLEQVEQQVGKLEADAMRQLDVSRAIAGLKAGNVQSIAQRTGSSKEAVERVAATIPKKLRKDKTSAATVKKQLDGLQAVMEEARKTGSPQMLATERLMAQALRLQGKVDAEVTFQKALKERMAELDRTRAVMKRKGVSDDAFAEAAAESPAGPVTKLMYDGFRTIDSSVYPEGTEKVLSDAAHELFTNFERQWRDEGQWLRYWDEANSFFKTYATATPGFHVRNLMSASFLNMSDGVGVGSHREAAKLWKRYVKAAESKEGAERFLADELTAQERDAFQAVFGSGVSGSYNAAELGDNLVSSTAGWLKDNRFTRFSRRMGVDKVEGPIRLAVTLDSTVNRGGSVHDALQRVTRLHFDYSDVSKLDRNMKRMIPFWTFMSRNLPLQVEQMWQKPRMFAAYNNLIENFDIGEDGEIMPEWMKAIGGFTVARNIGGPFGGRDIVLTPDLAHTRLNSEVLEGIKDPRDFLASATPFARVPVELIANRSMFHGGEVYDDDASTLKKLQQMGSYALNNSVPPVAQAQRLSGFGEYAGKAGERRLNYLGLPARGVGDQERANELRRRAFAQG